MYLMPRENLNVPSDQTFAMPQGIGSMDQIKSRLSQAVQQKMAEDDPAAHNIEGYIMKYSPALLKGWQKRWVTVKNKKLTYRKT